MRCRGDFGHGGEVPSADVTTYAGARWRIKPGERGMSTLFARIDANEMPPGDPFDGGEKQLVENWILDGALEDAP